MAPVTRSQTAVARMMGEKRVICDIQFIRELVSVVLRKTYLLSRAVACTKRCTHCKYFFKRERYPRLTYIQTDGSKQKDSKESSIAIAKLVRAKTRKHARKFKKECRLLERLVDQLRRTRNKCNAMRSMPARRCLYCFKFSKSDPFEYLQK